MFLNQPTLFVVLTVLVVGQLQAYQDDDNDFEVDDRLTDSIDEFRSRMLKDDDHKTRHPFEKSCPQGFFACNNGECISPKWRCDGHEDCDDSSDEFNCTKSTGHDTRAKQQSQLSGKASSGREEVNEIKFDSPQEPLMLFSTGLSIRGYWMRSRVLFDVVATGKRAITIEQSSSITQALSVFFDMLNMDAPAATAKSEEVTIKPRSTIVGVDLDPVSKEVYWVELGNDAGIYSTVIENENLESRHRRQHLGHQRKTIVDSGLLAPEDLALDIVGKNIYVTDAGLPAIVACSIKYNHCKIIVNESLHKPRAIIVDSSTGWLTYTDWGDHPGIFLVTMDGRRRETLIDTDVVWPNGLAADYSTDQLYWADARLGKIECVDLKTRKRREVIKEFKSNPFSLSLFENRIYWSDWSGSDIRTCDKFSGNGTKRIMRADNIYGIHIYHPSIYGKSSEREDPCWSSQCSHLCLISPTSGSFASRKSGSVTSVCACPESMALSIGDKATCYEVQFSFLLLNVKNYIAQIFPERIGLHIVEKVIYSKAHSIHDVASDWLHYRLFFFDYVQRHIYSVDLADKNVTINNFIETGQSVKGLLYDAWSDNLYWLNPDSGSMSMCPVKGRFELVMRRGLKQPTSLVLDSKNRVFYIAMLGSQPHIMRTDIHANENSDVMIISQDIGLPVALHLDEQQQRLYWADARRESIESIDLDVKSQTTGVRPASRLNHRRRLGSIVALAIYHDSFMWTVEGSDYLYKAKINDGHSNPITFNLPQPPHVALSESRRIILVDPRHEVVSSPCQRRGCSHGCILDANRDATCVCPDHYKLTDGSCLPTYVYTMVHPPGFDSPPQAGLATYSPPRAEPATSVAPTPAPAPGEKQAIVAEHPEHPEHLEAQEPRQEYEQEPARRGSGMVWLIFLLMFLSIIGLITLIGLFAYKQGKFDRQVSKLSVSFISNHDKDGSTLLLDSD